LIAFPFLLFLALIAPCLAFPACAGCMVRMATAPYGAHMTYNRVQTVQETKKEKKKMALTSKIITDFGVMNQN
jgi:hypothetical protein